jgi:peptide subunit release factor RF-3
MSWNHLGNGRFNTDLYRRLAAVTAALLVAQLTGGVVQEAAAILTIGRLLPPGPGRGPDRPGT